jgi:hypothetical protein
VCEIKGGARSYACHCRYERAPIHYAAELGHVSIVELLISKNADVKIQDRREFPFMSLTTMTMMMNSMSMMAVMLMLLS